MITMGIRRRAVALAAAAGFAGSGTSPPMVRPTQVA